MPAKKRVCVHIVDFGACPIGDSCTAFHPSAPSTPMMPQQQQTFQSPEKQQMTRSLSQ